MFLLFDGDTYILQQELCGTMAFKETVAEENSVVYNHCSHLLL